MRRRRKDHLSDGRVTGADIIAFIEAVCFVPEGRDVGKPLRLHDCAVSNPKCNRAA